MVLVKLHTAMQPFHQPLKAKLHLEAKSTKMKIFLS